MNRKKKCISYLLFFIFGFSVLKNLSPVIRESDLSDCAEFAHIHFAKFIPVSNYNSLVSSNSHDTANHGEDCHDGKVFSDIVVFPSPTAVVVPKFNDGFAVVFEIQNNFSNPNLDPMRKPPKIS